MIISFTCFIFLWDEELTSRFSLHAFIYYRQGDKLDRNEQSCLANCQDRYLDAREQVQAALSKRQDGM